MTISCVHANIARIAGHDKWCECHPNCQCRYDTCQMINVKCGGKVIMWKVWGSYSHGTELPTSDVDYCGVFVLPTEKHMGIYPPEMTIVGDKPDFQLHEVGKFCELLLKGNPGIVEMLFTEKMFFETEEWKSLRAQKHRFLSKRTVTNYIGYAEGQLQKIAKGTSVHTKGGMPSEKWGYHLRRLLYDSQRILDGGFPLVWKEGPELEHLMKIRRGEILPERVVDDAKTIIYQQREALKTSTLPENGDEKWLTLWLEYQRKNAIQSWPPNFPLTNP